MPKPRINLEGCGFAAVLEGTFRTSTCHHSPPPYSAALPPHANAPQERPAPAGRPPPPTPRSRRAPLTPPRGPALPGGPCAAPSSPRGAARQDDPRTAAGAERVPGGGLHLEQARRPAGTARARRAPDGAPRPAPPRPHRSFHPSGLSGTAVPAPQRDQRPEPALPPRHRLHPLRRIRGAVHGTRTAAGGASAPLCFPGGARRMPVRPG